MKNGTIVVARWRRATFIGLAGALLAQAGATTASADPSLAEIAAEIQALKAENRQIKAENQKMKAAIASIGGQTHRTSEKLRGVASRVEHVAATPTAPALPAGAIPAFVTANKQLQFGALTITPGGFFAAESVFRSRTVQADINTPWQSIPFGPQAGTNEFRFSSRATRLAGLIEAPIAPSLLVSGYGEFDFQGSAVNSTENQTDSFVPRIRNLYAALDFTDYGFHVLAGQNWSLATLNSKGITPRNEVTPPSIDSGYVPGFIFKRQPQIRITKDFGQKLWLSLSAEEPQTTYSGCGAGVNATNVPVGNTGTNNGGTAAAPIGSLVTCQLPGVGILNGATSTAGTNITNFSLNHVPDVIGKAAYELTVGERDVHFEGFGMYRDLYDRDEYATQATISQLAQNHNTTGFGVGGGVIAALLPRKLDVQASTLYGRGVGSYGVSQFSDATFNPNGSAAPITTLALLGGLTAHVTPSIDVYGFAGEEVAQPKYFGTNAAGTNFTGFGYGLPTANNSECFNTTTTATTGAGPGFSTATTCQGNTKRVFQLTGGMWDKLYRGSFGEVRVGVQYSYTERQLFSGNGFTTGGTAAAPTQFGPNPRAPTQNEHIVFTSLRYYPFQ